jgi:hypothetical protein
VIDTHILQTITYYLKIMFGVTPNIFTTYRPSLYTIDVECGPSSTSITAPTILPFSYNTIYWINQDGTYEMMNVFLSSFAICPIKEYDIEPWVGGTD